MINDYNTWRSRNGLPPAKTARVYAGVRLTQTEKQALESIAAENGYFHGSRGSISKLLAAIAEGYITLVRQ